MWLILSRSASLRAGLRRKVFVLADATRHLSLARATRRRNVPGYYLPSLAGLDYADSSGVVFSRSKFCFQRQSEPAPKESARLDSTDASFVMTRFGYLA
jgi:hypothetical protein